MRGMWMLTLRHLVVEHDGHFSAAPTERALIAYYANSIRHLREEHLTNEEVVALQLALDLPYLSRSESPIGE